MATSSASYNTGNMVVVTHVFPSAPSGEQQPLLDPGQRFKKGHSKVLGTVQIMIGVISLLFGITLAIHQDSLGMYSGIFVWGSALYIASGSVTVAAEKYLTRCLMTATLTLNIIAAVVAGIGVILYSLDAVVFPHPYAFDDGVYFEYYAGYSIVLAVFQLLQLIVSITMAGVTCYATCKCCREEPQVVVRTVDNPIVTQAPPQFQTASVAPAQPPAQMQPAFKSPAADFPSEPPAYEPASY